MPTFHGYYTQLRNRALFRWVDVRKRAVVRAFFGKRSGLRVLDLGCGSAAVSAAFAGRQQVHGVDADATLLEVARQRGLATNVGSFERVPFDDAFFDSVLMIDTLEHVESRERVFHEVGRVLKADGEFLAVTPNYASLLWNAAEPVALALSRRKSSGHISPFTAEALEYWLGRHFRSCRIGRLNAGMWLYGIGRSKL